MFDELIDQFHTEYISAASERQSQLVAEYCNGIQQKIAEAKTGEEAASLAERYCNTFRKSCSSELLAGSLERYVQELVKHYWSSNDNANNTH
ncbi:MAG: hypothetical protein H3C35_06645 [Bacteroidetes bacterium]|nr:hypothetical protein [Bacteroidota bacterium]